MPPSARFVLPCGMSTASTRNLLSKDPISSPDSAPREPITMRFVSIGLLLLLVGAPVKTSQVPEVAAQSGTERAIVKPRTVVIIRRGALIKDFPNKKRATVTYPVVSGLNDPQVLHRVQAILQI